MIFTGEKPKKTEFPNKRFLTSADDADRKAFALTSLYHSSWLVQLYGGHFPQLYPGKVVREANFREWLRTIPERPALMFMGNFIVDRAGIVALCRAHGINVIH